MSFSRSFPNSLKTGFCTLLFGLAACSEAPDGNAVLTGNPDRIYYNAKVITVDEDFRIAEAFAVDGENFVAVGNDENIQALAGDGTELINLNGATVIPGMADSHDHLWNMGKYLHRGVDMIGVDNFIEFQRRLIQAIVEAEADEVVFTTTGWAFQPTINKAMLDAIAPETPVVAVIRRRGAAILNTAALDKMGITNDNPEYMGAPLHLDENGELTGETPGYPYGELLLDELLPEITPAIENEIFAKEMAKRHALGITSIRDLALLPSGVAAYQRQREQGNLSLRASLGLEFVDPDEIFPALEAMGAPERTDPWLIFDSVSEEPWTPGAMPVEEYTEFLRGINELGWRPAPHTSSDMHRGISADDAANQTLQALETVNAESSFEDKRWVLEHVPFATPEQIERLADLGMLISTQGWGYWGVPDVDLPETRLAHYNATRSFVQGGITLVAGSDYNGPTTTESTPNNPMIPFYFYVTRMSRSGEIETPFEAISREDALRTLTSNAAYAVFQEDKKGQIAPGMWADFVILNQDLMTVPESQILNTRPLATYVGGKQVYLAPDADF